MPNINVLSHMKLLSSFSATDLKKLGPTLGISALDNPQSLKFNGVSNIAAATATYPAALSITGGLAGGAGITNNFPFSIYDSYGNQGDAPVIGAQGLGTYNNGLYSRMKRVADGTNGSVQNLYGTTSGVAIMSLTQLANEFKPYTTILNTY